MFIVFEGPEGCGKSTQAELAEKALQEKGRDVVLVREPGGTAAGEGIRKLLLESEDAIGPRAETLLFMASRAQLVDEVIRPALNNETTVLCKRFLSSTIAYQGYAGGEDIDAITALGTYATVGLKPDLTILLDINAGLGMSRVKSPDRIEKRGPEYHRNVRDGFLELAQQHADTYVVIDGTESIENIHEEVMKLIETRLS